MLKVPQQEYIKYLREMEGLNITEIAETSNIDLRTAEKYGERILTEDFMRFRNHYSFEAVFCNPGKGNEKGNVENKCGYTRRNFLVPLPIFKDKY